MDDIANGFDDIFRGGQQVAFAGVRVSAPALSRATARALADATTRATVRSYSSFGSSFAFSVGRSGRRGASQSSSPKAETHHIATNKNDISTFRGGPWTPRFRKIFEKAGLTLKNSANKIRVPGHRGPHPQAYHEAVFDRLRQATKGLRGKAYHDALVNELNVLANQIRRTGSRLAKLVTRQ